MDHEGAFRRAAGITAIASAGGILAATVVLLAAVDLDADFLSDPGLLLTLDEHGTELFRWGSYLELFAPGLLIVPGVLYLWYWIRPKNDGVVTTYTLFGLVSLFMAAVGSVLRATAWPAMITAHAEASEPQREVLAAVFQAATDFSFEGMWALELLLWGAWWLGIGLVLRSEKAALGTVTAVLGSAFLVAGAGWMLQIDLLARLETAYFLVPIWAVWLGVVILRRPDHDPATGQGATRVLTGSTAQTHNPAE